MRQISVAEAADRLGVGVARVHQRIADGSLPAERIGSQWVIGEAALVPVAESRPGRPLSRRSAWAVVALSEDNRGILESLAAAERARARARLHRLLASFSSPAAGSSEAQVQECAELLRALLRNRAERRLYRASPRDLPDLREDGRVRLSGLSHSRSGIASGDLVEGYLDADDVDALADDHLLSPVAAGQQANVVLHVVSGNSLGVMGGIAPLLLAADLAEHRGPREEFRAAEILREIVDRQSFRGVSA
ncbi:hypothetical protein [Krasilnikovia sp. MM14-A1259]|uniref:hypothetical protein n=1 Tax=Krasilnikovia sp. MM14-A1259 TaxID=3373539 RepID=UPI0037F70598